MSFLPRNLICLTLAHSLNDASSVERWLGEYPEVESCIPVALRIVLESSDLSPVPFFSTSELFQYLRIMWKNAPINNKLIEAASDGLTYLVAYLLNSGANIHAFNDEALIFAEKENHIDTVKLLLDRGANVHVHNEWLLTLAVDRGHFDMVRLLLDRGADIHAGNDRTLRSAISHNHPEIVKLLLDRKANASVLG